MAGREREGRSEWLIGVDAGGTFTDFFALGAGGQTLAHKVLSTPDDPARAVLEGLERLRELMGPGPHSFAVAHGSTVATNALLERKGAATAFLTTEGFTDLLALGRQDRPELYELAPELPEPLIPADRCLGVAERIGPDGSVVEPLAEEAGSALARRLKELGAVSVAVCFLHAYANPDHEARIAQALRRAGFAVSASHEILPEYREFERAAATVINAYVSPLMQGYLERLEERLKAAGSRRLRIVQSNGGAISAVRAGREAVHTVLSGPAGGAQGAALAAERAGLAECIAFDMGGTSTDVSLIIGGRPHITTEGAIGGLPLRIPTVDIHTVGAGGGSIAHLDAGGALRVGPQSAGASPGPACYGRGGSAPTVTDAHVLLGRLPAARFLGGRMRLDPQAAEAAYVRLAAELGATAEEAAWGALLVVRANMERAIRVISVERGHDPRRLALVSYGGAGGLHACELARALAIPTVYVPPEPGVLSAAGIAAADIVKTYSQGVLRQADGEGTRRAAETLERLSSQARSDLAEEGLPPERILLEQWADLRYQGQSFELTLPVPGEQSPEAWAEAFHRAHEAQYGYRSEEDPVEIVAVRLRATGRMPRPEQRPAEAPAHRQPSAPVEWTQARFASGFERTPVYRRQDLQAGLRLSGPAIVVEAHATLVLPPGDLLQVDGWGGLRVEVAAAEDAQGAGAVD